MKPENRTVERRKFGTVTWTGRAACIVSSLPPGVILDCGHEPVPVWDQPAARDDRPEQEDN